MDVEDHQHSCGKAGASFAKKDVQEDPRLNYNQQPYDWGSLGKGRALTENHSHGSQGHRFVSGAKNQEENPKYLLKYQVTEDVSPEEDHNLNLESNETKCRTREAVRPEEDHSHNLESHETKCREREAVRPEEDHSHNLESHETKCREREAASLEEDHSHNLESHETKCRETEAVRPEEDHSHNPESNETKCQEEEAVRPEEDHSHSLQSHETKSRESGSVSPEENHNHCIEPHENKSETEHPKENHTHNSECQEDENRGDSQDNGRHLLESLETERETEVLSEKHMHHSQYQDIKNRDEEEKSSHFSNEEANCNHFSESKEAEGEAENFAENHMHHSQCQQIKSRDKEVNCNHFSESKHTEIGKGEKCNHFSEAEESTENHSDCSDCVEFISRVEVDKHSHFSDYKEARCETLGSEDNCQKHSDRHETNSQEEISRKEDMSRKIPNRYPWSRESKNEGGPKDGTNIYNLKSTNTDSRNSRFTDDEELTDEVCLQAAGDSATVDENMDERVGDEGVEMSERECEGGYPTAAAAAANVGEILSLMNVSQPLEWEEDANDPFEQAMAKRPPVPTPRSQKPASRGTQENQAMISRQEQGYITRQSQSVEQDHQSMERGLQSMAQDRQGMEQACRRNPWEDGPFSRSKAPRKYLGRGCSFENKETHRESAIDDEGQCVAGSGNARSSEFGDENSSEVRNENIRGNEDAMGMEFNRRIDTGMEVDKREVGREMEYDRRTAFNGKSGVGVGIEENRRVCGREMERGRGREIEERMEIDGESEYDRGRRNSQGNGNYMETDHGGNNNRSGGGTFDRSEDSNEVQYEERNVEKRGSVSDQGENSHHARGRDNVRGNGSSGVDSFDREDIWGRRNEFNKNEKVCVGAYDRNNETRNGNDSTNANKRESTFVREDETTGGRNKESSENTNDGEYIYSRGNTNCRNNRGYFGSGRLPNQTSNEINCTDEENCRPNEDKLDHTNREDRRPTGENSHPIGENSCPSGEKYRPNEENYQPNGGNRSPNDMPWMNQENRGKSSRGSTSMTSLNSDDARSGQDRVSDRDRSSDRYGHRSRSVDKYEGRNREGSSNDGRCKRDEGRNENRFSQGRYEGRDLDVLGQSKYGQRGRGDNTSSYRVRGDTTSIYRGRGDNTSIYRGRGDNTSIYRGRGDNTSIYRGRGDNTSIYGGRGDNTSIYRGRGDNTSIYRGRGERGYGSYRGNGDNCYRGRGNSSNRGRGEKYCPERRERSGCVKPWELVEALAECPDFSVSMHNLKDWYDMDPNSVRQVVSVHLHIFQINGGDVELRPHLGLCQDHPGPSGCQGLSTCTGLHVCANYIRGNCRDRECFVGHHWHTEHNKKVLRAYCMERLPVFSLRNLMCDSLLAQPPSGQLDICQGYNSGTCRQTDCGSLHVCVNFVKGLTRCGVSGCIFNHNLHAQEIRTLLATHGFSTNEAPRDIAVALLQACPSLASALPPSNTTKSQPNNQPRNPQRSSTTNQYFTSQRSSAGYQNQASQRESNSNQSFNTQKQSTNNQSSTFSRSASLQQHGAVGVGGNRSRGGGGGGFFSMLRQTFMSNSSNTSTGSANDSNSNKEPIKSNDSTNSGQNRNGRNVSRDGKQDSRNASGGKPNTLAKKEKPQQTVWSHYLFGDTEINEICYYSVETSCRNESSGCRRLHCDLHFHWQISEEGSKWLNLRRFQSIGLEQAFCDPSQDGVSMPRLDPAKLSQSLNKLLTILGREMWKANFQAMVLCNSDQSKLLYLRRLCTEYLPGVKAATYAWFFSDKNNKWVRYGKVDSAGETNLVSSITSADIERHYRQKQHVPLTFSNASYTYVLDFVAMTQTNQNTKVQREVRRRPDPHLNNSDKQGVSGSGGASGSSGSSGNNGSSGINGASGSTGQSSSTSTSTGNGSLPSFWEPMQPEERVRQVTVPNNSTEYQSVAKLLGGTANNIVKMERVQNPFLWRALQNKIKDMTLLYKGDVKKVDVRQLFHGTKPDVIASICAENFDWRLHGTSTGQASGRGTYFSPHFATSYGYCRPDNSGHKFIFVARVAVGSITAGNPGTVRPPTNPSTGFPFDSTGDGNRVVVKYDKQEYCPEYVLTLR